MRRTAFTLFELLVAITIIALLLSLLLPVIGMVRDAAHTIACASNLRQIGLMNLAYANNRNGTLPPAYVRDSTMPWLGTTTLNRYGIHGKTFGECWEAWYTYLLFDAQGETQNAWNQQDSFYGYLTCPSAPNRPRGANAAFKSTHQFGGNSYGPNTAILGDTGSTGSGNSNWPNYQQSVTGWPGYGLGVPGLKDNARRRARIPRPSETILTAEHRGASFLLTPTGPQGWIKKPDDPWAYWTDAPFVRPPIDDQGRQMVPPASWGAWLPQYGWTDVNGQSVGLRVSHRGRSNYLFHDGRVAAMTPWETCAADPALANLWTGTAP